MTETKATYSDLPVCALCGCHPVNYHTGAFGVKHCCVDRHCTLHNVLFTSDQWRKLMGEPKTDNECCCGESEESWRLCKTHKEQAND